jgi:hypothetical protein
MCVLGFKIYRKLLQAKSSEAELIGLGSLRLSYLYTVAFLPSTTLPRYRVLGGFIMRSSQLC